MEGELSIEVEDVGMKNSIPEDEGGASQPSLNNASATVRTAEQQDRAKVYATTRKLADVINGANIKDITSEIKRIANQTDSSTILNFRGLSRGSLLHIAAATGKDDILRLLLYYVDANLMAATDDWGNTPLHIAIEAKALGVTEILIGRARDLSNVENRNQILRMRNKHGNTALHEAVLTHDVGLVSLVFNEDLEPLYLANADRKSPLYLALDTSNSKIHEVLFSNLLDPSKIEGLPPVHGAILRHNYGLLSNMLKWNKNLIAMTDSKGGNIFHLAAFVNWPKVFELLSPETEYLARERDMNGNLPIHVASRMGNFELIKKLHPYSQSLNGRGQTVLHVAAKHGKALAVRDILTHLELGKLINERDDDGNTALHLATRHSQPAAVISLLQDKRIDEDLTNPEGWTALHVAVLRVTRWPSARTALVFLVLESRGPVNRDFIALKPEARDTQFPALGMNEVRVDKDLVKDNINTRLVVATLVATVTFAAGFAVPGGFNSSDLASKGDRGMATMLDNRFFQVFTICNTIAMFCSMTAVANLMFAQRNDVREARNLSMRTDLPLAIALPAMSTAFLTGATSVLDKLHWLRHTIFYLGLVFLFGISRATLAACTPFFTYGRGRLRPLTLRLILAFMMLWPIETFLWDDPEGEGTASGTSASQPPHGAPVSKTNRSATPRRGDSPHHPDPITSSS